MLRLLIPNNREVELAVRLVGAAGQLEDLRLEPWSIPDTRAEGNDRGGLTRAIALRSVISFVSAVICAATASSGRGGRVRGRVRRGRERGDAWELHRS